MTSQLIITMRGDFAERFARDDSIFDIQDVVKAIKSARLIGKPGYSMRLAVDESDVGAVRQVLARDFVIEKDYVLNSFDTAPKAAKTRRR